MLQHVVRIITTTFKELIINNDLKGRNRGLFEIRTKSQFVRKNKKERSIYKGSCQTATTHSFVDTVSTDSPQKRTFLLQKIRLEYEKHQKHPLDKILRSFDPTGTHKTYRFQIGIDVNRYLPRLATITFLFK
jgi:hypothetical protein